MSRSHTINKARCSCEVWRPSRPSTSSSSAMEPVLLSQKYTCARWRKFSTNSQPWSAENSPDRALPSGRLTSAQRRDSGGSAGAGQLSSGDRRGGWHHSGRRIGHGLTCQGRPFGQRPLSNPPSPGCRRTQRYRRPKTAQSCRTDTALSMKWNIYGRVCCPYS